MSLDGWAGNFDLNEIEEDPLNYRFPPPVSDELGREILSTLAFADDRFPGCFQARVGLVWDDGRNSPMIGSTLRDLKSDDQLYIVITYAVDRHEFDKDWSLRANEQLSGIFLRAKEEHHAENERKLEAERQAKLAEIAKLETQIAKIRDTL